jgi:hypothetical protein
VKGMSLLQSRRGASGGRSARRRRRSNALSVSRQPDATNHDSHNTICRSHPVWTWAGFFSDSIFTQFVLTFPICAPETLSPAR